MVETGAATVTSSSKGGITEPRWEGIWNGDLNEIPSGKRRDGKMKSGNCDPFNHFLHPGPTAGVLIFFSFSFRA